jgi:hypothetical protein
MSFRSQESSMTDAKTHWCLVVFDVSIVEGTKHSLEIPLKANRARTKSDPRYTKLYAGIAAGKVKFVVSPP